MSTTTTTAAPFTFAYADLVAVHGRKLRLFRAYAGNQPEQYIKACRLSTANVIEKSNGRDEYQHNNAAGYPVALIGGNMLDAENGAFWVAYFGVDTGRFDGAGYRYRTFIGLAAAEAAVEKWAARKFRVPAVADVVTEPSAEEVKAVAEEVTAYIASTEIEYLVPVLVQALFGEAGVYILKVPGEVKKSLNRLRSNDMFFFHGGAKYDIDADCSFVYFERQPEGKPEALGFYNIGESDGDRATGCVSCRTIEQLATLTRANAQRLRSMGQALTGQAVIKFGGPEARSVKIKV